MEVYLIDYTGAGHPDPWYAAKKLIYTKNTRLTQGEDLRAQINLTDKPTIMKELEAIMMTVRSSWEFVSFTWQILGVTRAFTHQHVRTRTASYAQQAQRVVNMSDFEATIPMAIAKEPVLMKAWQDCIEEIRYAYSFFRSHGVAAQDARAVLPTNVQTNIITEMNLRVFADLCGKRDNLRAQDEYQEVIRAMKAEVLRVMPWTEMFLDPPRTRTPELDAILKNALNGKAPVDVPEVNAALKQIDALKGVWG